MDYVYIEQLIDRYFEAATTIEEERILRAFFSQRDVPQHLRRYAPIFLMEAGEIAENRVSMSTSTVKSWLASKQRGWLPKSM